MTTRSRSLFVAVFALVFLVLGGCQRPPEPLSAADCCTHPPDCSEPAAASETTPKATATPKEADDPGQALVRGVEDFDVGGIRVLLKRTPGKPLVSAGLYLKGGTVELAENLTGIDELFVSLVREGGTEGLPSGQFSAELDGMGTSFGGSANKHYVSFGLGAVRKHWDRSFELFSQVLLEPALPEDELELVRTRHLEYIKGLEEDADNYISLLGTDLLFEGHPYAKRTWGTIENTERVDVAAIRARHSALMQRKRMLFVVIGDVTREDVEAKLAAFVALPEGSFEAKPLPPFAEKGGRINVYEKADIPTSYVLSFFKAPDPTHEDYYPMVVATRVLSARLFEKLRTKLNLTYGVSAGLSKHPSNYGYLYVTSRWPTAALSEIYDEVEAMQNWLIPETEIEDTVAAFITRHYMSLETLSAQRGMLANAQLLRGDWRRSAELIRGLRAVTADDVRRVMSVYIKDLQVGYYGDPKALDADLATSDPRDADRVLIERSGFTMPEAAKPKAEDYQ